MHDYYRYTYKLAGHPVVSGKNPREYVRKEMGSQRAVPDTLKNVHVPDIESDKRKTL